MEYNIKKRCLDNDILFTIVENKILISLSNNNAISYEEICKYVFGIYNKEYKGKLKSHISNMRKKGLKIKSIYNYGYRLKNIISFY